MTGACLSPRACARDRVIDGATLRPLAAWRRDVRPQSVRPPASPSVCPSVRLSTSPLVCRSARPSASPLVCPSVSPPASPLVPVRPSASPSVCPSASPLVRSSVGRSVRSPVSPRRPLLAIQTDRNGTGLPGHEWTFHVKRPAGDRPCVGHGTALAGLIELPTRSPGEPVGAAAAGIRIPSVGVRAAMDSRAVRYPLRGRLHRSASRPVGARSSS